MQVFFMGAFMTKKRISTIIRNIFLIDYFIIFLSLTEIEFHIISL